MEKEYSSFWHMIGMRFVRGFITGAFGSMTVIIGGVSTNPPVNLEALLSLGQMLAFSCAIGAVGGGFLAIEKGLRYWLDRKYPEPEIMLDNMPIPSSTDSEM